jgi:hypothetical protein
MPRCGRQQRPCTAAEPPAVRHSPAAGLKVIWAVCGRRKPWLDVPRGLGGSGSEGGGGGVVEAVLAGPGCVAGKLNAYNARPVPNMSPQRVGPACCGLAAGCPTRRGPARTPRPTALRWQAGSSWYWHGVQSSLPACAAGRRQGRAAAAGAVPTPCRHSCLPPPCSPYHRLSLFSLQPCESSALREVVLPIYKGRISTCDLVVSD